jgi:DNA-binding transcriptional LysR family regulator
MTLQQLRYVIQVAKSGSITLAARELDVAQPSLSKAISDLEKEMGVIMFVRGGRGIRLTDGGTRFLSYARQVMEQVDLLEQQYRPGRPIRRVFAISSQHYAFVVNAFVALVKEYGKDTYEFTIRESHDIIQDVRFSRSELGILFLSHFNREVLLHLFQKEDLRFTSLFTATPHVFISRRHPLAGRARVTFSDLTSYPRLVYEQGEENSFYFSEELHSTMESAKDLVVTDRATLFNLLIGLDGYTICSGILSSDLNGTDIIAKPLESDEEMEIGYLTRIGEPLSPLGMRYVTLLKGYVASVKA